jgi:hypothetical protein
LWDPAYRALGAAFLPETVTTPYAETEVYVPDIDPELRPVVGAFCVLFTSKFYSAQRCMTPIALEAVALLYCNLGGTDADWLAFLDTLGIAVAPQSRNLFVSFLTWICGTAVNKRSNKLGKMAKALAAWAAIYRPGPATLGDQKSDDWGSPDPVYTEEGGPGSSAFAAWLKAGHGYSRIAENYSDSPETNTPPAPPEPTPSPEPSPNHPTDASPPPASPERPTDASQTEQPVDDYKKPADTADKARKAAQVTTPPPPPPKETTKIVDLQAQTTRREMEEKITQLEKDREYWENAAHQFEAILGIKDGKDPDMLAEVIFRACADEFDVFKMSSTLLKMYLDARLKEKEAQANDDADANDANDDDGEWEYDAPPSGDVPGKARLVPEDQIAETFLSLIRLAFHPHTAADEALSAIRAGSRVLRQSGGHIDKLINRDIIKDLLHLKAIQRAE